MLATKKDGKGKLFLIDGDFEGYYNEEGYKRVLIVGADTSTSEKGYIVLYVFNMDNQAVNKVNLRIQSPNDHTSEVPLEKIIRLALGDGMEEDCYFYEVNLDDLIGFELQIKIEKDRMNGYYNVTGVYHIDEELGEFVSKKVIDPRIKNIFANR